MDHVLYQIFKIVLSMLSKKHPTVTDNLPLRMYVLKQKIVLVLELKKGTVLNFLMVETMKLLGRTKSKITKDENDENVPHLEITEVILLVHANITTMIINRIQGSFFKKTFNSEFSYIEVWFTPQNSETI